MANPENVWPFPLLMFVGGMGCPPLPRPFVSVGGATPPTQFPKIVDLPWGVASKKSQAPLHPVWEHFPYDEVLRMMLAEPAVVIQMLNGGIPGGGKEPSTAPLPTLTVSRAGP